MSSLDAKAQAVKDLLWAINSPSLVDGSDVAQAEPISSDDIDGEHLSAFLDEQPDVHRVGRYFEQLVSYWLLHVRKVEVVATGMQLKEGKITIGEIDFLYRNEADTLVHAEASVKFFLYVPGAEPSEYPGPNARDNFEAKVTKLFDKQLKASEGRIDDISEREGFIRGMIFYRDNSRPETTPNRLAPDHQQGHWCYANELETLEAAGDQFSIVAKPHWLAPQLSPPVMTFDQLADHLRNHFNTEADGPNHPLMLSVRSEAEPNVENTRSVVVPATWPWSTPGSDPTVDHQTPPSRSPYS